MTYTSYDRHLYNQQYYRDNKYYYQEYAKEYYQKNKQTLNSYRSSWAKNQRLKNKNKPMIEVSHEKTIIKFN